MLREAVSADPVKGGEGVETLRDGVIGCAGWARPHRGYHEVLRGVLRGDEFKDLSFVTRPLEELGSEGVGDEFGLTLLENAVPQRVGEDGWRGELRAELFLTAR